MGLDRQLRILVAAVAIIGSFAATDANAEVKESGKAAPTPAAERQSANASWELICYQAGREIVHERGLKSVATPGGPGALITYITANDVPAYVIVGTEATCLSRPDVKSR